MITSGRCHGPNCQQAALVVGGFCSESCQARWNIRVEGRPEPHPTQADLDAALRAVQPQLEAHLAAVIQAVDPPPASTFTVAEVARIAESLRSMPRPEPAKLTEEQLAALRQALPDRPGWTPNTQVSAFDGVPIEIVETVEESTPYQLQRQRRFTRLAAEIPPAVIAMATYGMSGRMAARKGIEAERLTLAIRAVCPPEHLEAALAEAPRRPGGLQSVYDDLARGWLPASAGAAYEQVAPKDPQVGWLAKWINRLFGRTT